MSSKITRRDFLKLTGVTLGGVAFSPYLPPLEEFADGQLVRVGTTQVSVYNRPDDTSTITGQVMLPMMYMPDCLKATIDLFQADYSKLKHHSDFNLAAMSFTPAILAESIKKHIPEFTIDYKIDFRQAIADSWPRSIDDTAAREEWGWKPAYDLDLMTADMLKVLGEKHKKGVF